jgi:hypothetical protein
VETVTTWLASGLRQLTAPDPASAPPDMGSVLATAFQVWDGRGLVSDLMKEIRTQSLGVATIEYADPATFTAAAQIRGPAAYLLVTGRRRFVLVPDPANPIRFDD